MPRKRAPMKRRTPRPYKKAGTKPKGRHPGRAYPAPRAKLVPKGRGKRAPSQMPASD